jgi:hypothetical protein
MSIRRSSLVIVGAVALLLIVWVSLRSPGHVQAESVVPGSQSATVMIPYAARLEKAAGLPASDGLYDLTFPLYDAESDEQLLWTETHSGIQVTAGTVAASLGSRNALASQALAGSRRWLAVSV